MTQRTATQPVLPPRLWLVAASGFVGAIGIFLLFSVWGIFVVNQETTDRETVFVRQGLAELVEQLPTQQESSTIWDEAVVRTRANDQAWMEENLGVWMATYFEHDRDYVLNADDEPIYAMQDGLTRSSEVYLSDEALVDPLVGELREMMEVATMGLTDATEAITPLSVVDFRMGDRGPELVSVRAIVPSTDNLSLAPSTEYLHVAIRNVDNDFLAEIAGRYHLNGVHLIPSTGVASSSSVPITDRAGKVLGYVGWQPDTPGQRMAFAVAPGFAIAVTVGLCLILYLVFRVGSAWRELKASEAQALFLAFHDTLTGLPNRALFDERLDRVLAAQRQSNSWVALQTIDLDGFKLVNDTLGHPAGDELIRLVAVRLGKLFGQTDTVARLGGDEFAVLQTDVSPREAEAAAARILIGLSEPFDLHGEKAFVSASIGISMTDVPSISREELLRRADIALYEAKARGRARYQVFEGAMDDTVRQRREIEQDLRTALTEGNQIRLVYQPVFARDGISIVGAEALARWLHPTKGSLAPDIFISTAEERGLIDELGDWVLREAARFALCTSLPWVAVNVSPVQLRKSDFAARVLEILRDVGLKPSRLQLEITEGVLLENPARTERTLEVLRRAGIRIALDDFGTGYSSLSYLRRYAVDKLKIDRSYVAELGLEKDAEAIIRSIVTLARSLRLKITAEGVETAAQQALLVAIGCDELQGFGLSKPVPELELQRMLVQDQVLLAETA